MEEEEEEREKENQDLLKGNRENIHNQVSRPPMPDILTHPRPSRPSRYTR